MGAQMSLKPSQQSVICIGFTFLFSVSLGVILAAGSLYSLTMRTGPIIQEQQRVRSIGTVQCNLDDSIDQAYPSDLSQSLTNNPFCNSVVFTEDFTNSKCKLSGLNPSSCGPQINITYGLASLGMSEQCRATKFESADTFTSGYVETMLKVPKASSGFIAAFYLRSETGDDTAEDEIDFEWLFKPGVNGVQSNYFTKGIGRGLNERWHSALLLAESQNNWNKFGIRWVNDQFVEWFINDKSIRRIELVNAPTSINYPMKVYFSFWAADSRVYNWAGIPDWTLPIDDYEFQIKYMAVCQG